MSSVSRMNNLFSMTPKEHIFRSLRRICKILRDESDLNSKRETLIHSLENIMSWESQVINKTKRITCAKRRAKPLV